MLGIAEAAFCGTSSVLKTAMAWNIKILKYRDLMSCIRESQRAPARQATQQKKGHVPHLRSSFVKAEVHSRKNRPEFVLMKSFPFPDLGTVGRCPHLKSGGRKIILLYYHQIVIKL